MTQAGAAPRSIRSAWSDLPANVSILSLALAFCGAWAMGWHLMCQLTRFDATDTDRLLHLFRSNRDAGRIRTGS